jgi:hypothetical protein
MTFGLVDEDEDVQETADRSYWENRASKKTVAMADQILEIARLLDPELELKYNKLYIGLAKQGQPNNFIVLRPKKGFLRFEPRLKSSSETQQRLENAGLDVMEYSTKKGRYRIRLQPSDIEKGKEALTEVIRDAFKSSVGE